MRVNDERAGLPADLWGRGEDYIWYSQGPHRWGSSIEQGYIADMGLNARHMHAAGGGRPSEDGSWRLIAHPPRPCGQVVICWLL